MPTRLYSSFLLRFWHSNSSNASDPGADKGDAVNPMVLELQHLQTGTTWRMSSLHELNEFLNYALTTDPANLLPDEAGSTEKLANLNEINREVE